MRGNFLSLPTDCPQRDERLGWTGDIQVFAPTASYLYDVSGFLGSWLRDLALEQQRRDGVVPFVVPHRRCRCRLAGRAWGDAATLVPVGCFTRGSVTPPSSSTQYASMRSWVDTVAALAGERYLWTGGFQFGDWLDPQRPAGATRAGEDRLRHRRHGLLLPSTARLARGRGVLGHDEDAARYGELADRHPRRIPSRVCHAGRPHGV